MNEQAHNELMALLSIPGQPGDERAVAEHLRRELISMGVRAESVSTDKAHEQSEYGGNIGNLIVRSGGIVSWRNRRPFCLSHSALIYLRVAI